MLLSVADWPIIMIRSRWFAISRKIFLQAHILSTTVGDALKP
jgi:hypothetical protein